MRKINIIFLFFIFSIMLGITSIIKNQTRIIDKNIFLTQKKIVALGGISKNNLEKLNLINCFGFAGISFFE